MDDPWNRIILLSAGAGLATLVLSSLPRIAHALREDATPLVHGIVVCVGTLVFLGALFMVGRADLDVTDDTIRSVRLGVIEAFLSVVSFFEQCCFGDVVLRYKMGFK